MKPRSYGGRPAIENCYICTNLIFSVEKRSMSSFDENIFRKIGNYEIY